MGGRDEKKLPQKWQSDALKTYEKHTLYCLYHGNSNRSNVLLSNTTEIGIYHNSFS